MNFLVSLLAGLVLTFVLTAVLAVVGRVFQLWRVLPERTVLVYTFFGKVVGQADEPGLGDERHGVTILLRVNRVV